MDVKTNPTWSRRLTCWLALALVGLPAGSGWAAPDEARAKLGDAQAQYDLAAAYFQGQDGYPKNVPLALEWLGKAAAQGNAAASYRLGEIYFHGYGGMPKDLAKAAAAFAAAPTFQEAKTYLGYMHFMGQGLPVNEAKGLALLREAAAQGQANATKLLWEAYAGGKLAPTDDAELGRLLEAGVAAGDVRAKEALGVRLMMGQGVPKDVARARQMLPEMAERGSVLAASALAQDCGERLTDPKANLSDRERSALDAQFKRMVHLVALFGGPNGRVTYVRVISRLTPLAQLAPKAADGSIVVSDELVEALAWARHYRDNGGDDKPTLAWLQAGEAWIADYAHIRSRLAAKERLLGNELARVAPRTPKA